MTSHFSEVCTLFQHIEDLELRQVPLRAIDKADRIDQVIKTWFSSHRASIDKSTIQELVALLSCLLPERRPDRVYGLQVTSLSRILPRAMRFGNSSTKILTAYKEPGRGDLAACTERAMHKEPISKPSVTLIQVDELLDSLAGFSQFSDSTLRQQKSTSSREQLIADVFNRLPARDGKWLVRLILKDLSPVQLDEQQMLRSVHLLLPDLLRFQNTFKATATLLKTTLREYPSTCEPRLRNLLKQAASSIIRPEVGVKLGRPTFLKARSIEHCQNMVGKHRWVLERKYDGEYCEIHIDLSWSAEPTRCIKIFAKSGKDATNDRKDILADIAECLKLGKPDSPVKERAILLGELVVWSDLSNTVLPFEEVRRHVTRSGRYLGTKHDSKPPSYEHLCMVFFDLLLLDEDITMSKSVEQRRNDLRKILTKKRGRAKTAEWKVIDFEQNPKARESLMQNFAASNAEKCEGLVLKPCGVPYFSLENPEHRVLSYVKLKKDYIQGLGDEADFAVIGASYNAQQAISSGLARVRYTDFHLGALMNKEEVLRFGRRPMFHFVGTIQQDHCVPRPIFEAINDVTVWDTHDTSHRDFNPTFDIVDDESVQMAVHFREPFVFEVLGSGYVKPPNADYLMLRHPRVKKWHLDRSWKDCVTFDELQRMAEEARDSGIASESQQNQEELDRLEATLKKKFERQRTMTPSPKKRISPLKVMSQQHTSSPSRVQTLLSSSPPRFALHKRPPTVETLPSSPPPRLALQKPPATVPTLPSSPPRLALHRRALAEVNSNTVTRQSNGISDISPPKTRRKREAPTSNNRAEDEIKRVCSKWVDEVENVLPDTTPVTSVEITSIVEDVTSRKITTVELTKEDHQLRCSRSECPFKNSVVYLAPCISATPYIVSDLLQCHDTTRMTTWHHCIRDRQRYSQHSATVGESQAYPDMQRVVFVESRRPGPMMHFISGLTVSNPSLDAYVEIYDWRILEEIKDHELNRELFKKHFVGCLNWNDTLKRAVFNIAQK